MAIDVFALDVLEIIVISAEGREGVGVVTSLIFLLVVDNKLYYIYIYIHIVGVNLRFSVAHLRASQ
jgi:hypothetical protein